MTLLAALFVLAWDPVTRDCRGALERYPPAYEVLIWEARVMGYTDDGYGGIVPIYSKVGQRQMTVQTSMTVQEPAAPAVGEVTLVGEPVAVDVAGNRSEATCSQ